MFHSSYQTRHISSKMRTQSTVHSCSTGFLFSLPDRVSRYLLSSERGEKERGWPGVCGPATSDTALSPCFRGLYHFFITSKWLQIVNAHKQHTWCNRPTVISLAISPHRVPSVACSGHAVCSGTASPTFSWSKHSDPCEFAIPSLEALHCRTNDCRVSLRTALPFRKLSWYLGVFQDRCIMRRWLTTSGKTSGAHGR